MSFSGMILRLYCSSMDTWFGICNAPDLKMWTRNLVYPLLVAQTTWFGMRDVFSVKEEWVEHSIDRRS